MKKTRFVILGLLNEEPLSGYDIKKIIDIRMSFFWQESYGQIYPELAKLRKEGLIEQISVAADEERKHDYDIMPEGPWEEVLAEKIAEPEQKNPPGKGKKKSARPEKIRYRITREGQEALKRWMEAENEKDTTRSEFLLKMYLATDDNREEMRRHLTEFHQQAQQKLMLFTMFQKELQSLADEHDNHRQLLRVLDLGLRQARLYAEWSKEMLEDY
jgi:DNA-binding PadR family transcriptional regulator